MTPETPPLPLFRVLVVDDEKWSLLGLRRIVDWESLGFRICWETTDSLEALNIIEAEEPDLVVSDIVMPELTGLEMIISAREKEIDSEFLFVSGFADFYYAQRAMEYGAFYYLLKPLKKEEVSAALLRARKALAQKERLGVQKSDLDLYEQFSLTLTRQEVSERLHLATNYPLLQAALFSHVSGGLTARLEALTDCLFTRISMGAGRRLYLFNCKEPLDKRLSVLFSDNETISAGLSSVIPAGEPQKLLKIYRESKLALLDRFVEEDRRFFSFRPRSYAVIRPLVSRCLDSMLGGGTECAQVFREAGEAFRQNHLGISEAAFLYHELAYHLSARYPDKEAVQDMEFMDCEQLFNKFGTMDGLFLYLGELSQSLQGQEEPPAMENKNFSRLLSYVDAHFADSLYLDEVAKKFYLSSVYVCKLFKQFTGTPFSKYIMELRLNEACRLLTATDETIAEISDRVGYHDYFYFNRIFKKNKSVTPAIYRKLNTP